MTFAGSNFDILQGFLAPLVYYFELQKHKLSQKMMIAWNILICAYWPNIRYL